MQLDDLTIALRTRTPWEATDLGIALVRAHAARIYAAWVLITLPVFAVLNLAASLLGWSWLAALVLWWLKPVFDRVVLFVISRAVFGHAPTLRETLGAQRSWGWRGIMTWLLWRRFNPGRAMLLPVDLLEGLDGMQRRERVGVLANSGSPSAMLTFIGANLEAMLSVSFVLLGLMFVPVEFLSDSAKAIWHTLYESPPWWAQLLLNLCQWGAMTVIEPFYIGAGFGLYLNRRMQLEGWDIELAFRRIAARLSQGLATAAMLMIVMLAFSAPARASDAPRQSDDAKTQSADSVQCEAHVDDDKHAGSCIKSTLPTLFGDGFRDDGKPFEDAVKNAYADADLSPTTRGFVWKRRHPEADPEKMEDVPAWARGIGSAMGFVFQYGLWILLAIVLTLVVVNHRRWLPWISDRMTPVRALDETDLHTIARQEPLPADIPAAVRALLRQARVRDALALLYRAGVERLADALGTPLPPGATESECLRQARRLRDPRYAALFSRIVRGWQAAAYAQHPPAASEVEAMLVDWSAPSPETPA